MRFAAILWDYDGTLVDSAIKNRAVTAALYARLRPGAPLPPSLGSLQAYRQALAAWPDWESVFRCEFGLSAQEVAAAGRLWDAGLVEDATAPPLFLGLRDVLPRLAACAPMGIVSHNSERHIRQTLRRYGVESCFGAVIGRERLPAGRGKPDAAGFLACLAALGMAPGAGELVYIGDRALDVQFARAAAAALGRAGRPARVYMVAAGFAPLQPLPAGADACARTPCQLPALLEGLQRAEAKQGAGE